MNTLYFVFLLFYNMFQNYYLLNLNLCVVHIACFPGLIHIKQQLNSHFVSAYVFIYGSQATPCFQQKSTHFHMGLRILYNVQCTFNALNEHALLTNKKISHSELEWQGRDENEDRTRKESSKQQSSKINYRLYRLILLLLFFLAILLSCCNIAS